MDKTLDDVDATEPPPLKLPTWVEEAIINYGAAVVDRNVGILTDAMGHLRHCIRRYAQQQCEAALEEREDSESAEPPLTDAEVRDMLEPSVQLDPWLGRPVVQRAVLADPVRLRRLAEYYRSKLSVASLVLMFRTGGRLTLEVGKPLEERKEEGS